MRKQFQGEVKRVRGKTPGKPSSRRTPKDPALHGAGRDEDSKQAADRDEQSPLKTAGGTPIVQRTPEG